MAQNPETQALLEKALQHVLEEQSKVLNHSKGHLFMDGIRSLGELATKTWEVISQGYHKIERTTHLTTLARKIETKIDDVSEQNWIQMQVSVSGIYERIEETFALRPIEQRLKLKAAIEVRNHFHNLRVNLLGQLLGARMLINNNDYGSELQRVWQEFLQRQLGVGFRVLEGGHIMDHEGNNANAQIDLIVVPSDAQVLVPSSLEDGKVNVLCDQVIAAIMVTSNLTADKLEEDWQKLERVAGLFKFSNEFPHASGKEQAWPLCYVVAGQSAPLDKLEKVWKTQVQQSPGSTFVPQLLISLDSGFLFSGAMSWPRPRYPGNYVERDDVDDETGIYGGLGIAWLLTQIRARALVLQGRSTKSLQRFLKLLDDAKLKSGVPPTWSKRFETFFSSGPIAGVLHWGHTSGFLHNRLHAISLERHLPGLELLVEKQYYKQGTDVSKLDWKNECAHLRWFRYRALWQFGELIALEEWTKNPEGNAYSKSYAVFDSSTGLEVTLSGPLTELGGTIENALEIVAARPRAS